MQKQAEMFRNRLHKNLRRLVPWARQRKICAYRLYDRDIPEVGLAVDRYGEHIHVAEYARGSGGAQRRGPLQPRLCGDEGTASSIDGDEAERKEWLDGVLGALRELCEIAPDDARLHLKLRRRQRGAAQYEKLGAAGREMIIPEGGHRFLVNLDDYLDTGLFLDHRDTRGIVQRLAPGKQVLNLFGYTGAFSVYAARGGAAGTLTVDLSNTYLDWAGRNFELNRLDPAHHRLLRADARVFLRDEAAAARRGRGTRYDLIVLDPPTFSNSKSMDGVLDIGLDHPDLLRDALALLSPGGTLLFSSNFRGLKLRADEVPGAGFQDISPKTIPKDFHDQLIHRCWLVRRLET